MGTNKAVPGDLDAFARGSRSADQHLGESATRPLLRGAVVGGASNVVGGAASRGLYGEHPFDPRAMGTDLLTGGGAGAVGGHLADETRNVRTIDRVLERPGALENKNPTDVLRAAGGEPPAGWQQDTLGTGTHEGQGWALREFTERGHTTDQLIRYHPGGGRHGPDPYWRVSSGEGGKSGIIPGASWP